MMDVNPMHSLTSWISQGIKGKGSGVATLIGKCEPLQSAGIPRDVINDVIKTTWRGLSRESARPCRDVILLSPRQLTNGLYPPREH
jgi:hypothetical protein